MTHDGPQDFATTNALIRKGDNPDLAAGMYRFGSQALGDLLKSKQEHIVCNIHGHDHYGAFTDYVRKEDLVTVPVVNPGSLNFGEYGSIELTKVDGKWKVTEMTKKFV